MKMIWCEWKIEENDHVLVNQFHGNFHSKTLGCRKIRSVIRDVRWCFNALWGLKGLMNYQCGILLAISISCVFLQQTRIFRTLKTDSFFARRCSIIMFMGFRKGHNPFAVNGDNTRSRQWLTLLFMFTFQKLNNNRLFCFLSDHLGCMQIWTECPVLKKQWALIIRTGSSADVKNIDPQFKPLSYLLGVQY